MPSKLLDAIDDPDTHAAVNDLLQRHFGNTKRVTPMSDFDSYEATRIMSRFGRDVSKGVPLTRWIPKQGTVQAPGSPGIPGAQPNRATAVLARTGIALGYVQGTLMQASAMVGESLVNRAFTERKTSSYELIVAAVLATGVEMTQRVPPQVKKKTMRDLGQGRRIRIQAFSKK